MIEFLGKYNKSIMWTWFCGLWAGVIFVPLIPFPAPAALIGHPWKVELIFSLMLSIILFWLILVKKRFFAEFSINQSVIFQLILPISLFIIWSAISVFWANSDLSVFHHTSVWICYLAFFLLALQIVSKNKWLRVSLTSLTLVVGIVAGLCCLEFFSGGRIGEVYTARYARFGDIDVAMLPLLLAFVLRFSKKNLLLASGLFSIVWLATLCTLSRSALLSGCAGLFIFLILRLLSGSLWSEKKRLSLALAGLVIVFGLSQLPSLLALSKLPEQKVESTLTRFSKGSDDQSNSVQKNVRLLFSGVAFQMISKNPIGGIGADNYGLEFNNYRVLFSANKKNMPVASLQEEQFPERAHNEYLQILAELGVTSGVFFLLFIIGILKFSIKEVFNRHRSNILAHAALAGMAAFLMNSLFSSFSFRLLQNGIVFFFLLAILVRRHSTDKYSPPKNYLLTPHKTIFVSLLAIICSLLAGVSLLRATSQYLTYKAESETDSAAARALFNTAERLDPSSAAVDYSYANKLIEEKDFPAAATEFRKAIDKGLNTSVAYSYLAASQILSGDEQAAKETLSEAIKIFPYSVFLQVRYAAVLKDLGNLDESAKHLEIAGKLSLKQAETWWSLVTEGVPATNQKVMADREAVGIGDLYPYQAVYSILTERNILYPQERTKFNFEN